MIDVLISEVNEDLRRDRIFALWFKWRKKIFTVSLALIIGSAAYSTWQYVVDQKAQKAMDTFNQGREAFRKGDYDTAYAFFHPLTQSATGNLNDLNRLWEARTLVKQEKPQEAITLLVALAEKPLGKDLIWRDLACLRLAGMDESKLPASCADAGNSPLKPQRYELRAAQLVEQGKAEEAKALLKTIADDESAASTVRARAQALLVSLDAAKP